MSKLPCESDAIEADVRAFKDKKVWDAPDLTAIETVGFVNRRRSQTSASPAAIFSCRRLQGVGHGVSPPLQPKPGSGAVTECRRNATPREGPGVGSRVSGS